MNFSAEFTEYIWTVKPTNIVKKNQNSNSAFKTKVDAESGREFVTSHPIFVLRTQD